MQTNSWPGWLWKPCIASRRTAMRKLCLSRCRTVPCPSGQTSGTVWRDSRARETEFLKRRTQGTPWVSARQTAEHSRKTCVSLFSRDKPIRNCQGKKGPSTAERAVEKEGDWKTSSNSVPEVFQSRRGENYLFLHSVRNQLFKLSLLSLPHVANYHVQGRRPFRSRRQRWKISERWYE